VHHAGARYKIFATGQQPGCAGLIGLLGSIYRVGYVVSGAACMLACSGLTHSHQRLLYSGAAK